MQTIWIARKRVSTVLFFALALLLSGCALVGAPSAAALEPHSACPVTEPVLLTPPEDSAVLSEPAEGYYFTNEDQSMLASAWWWQDEQEGRWKAGELGNKVGWFRPAGAALEISGRRLDGDAPPLQAQVPCCYPTRFQATGLIFPTGGCWEVTAKAADKMLTFVAWVD